MQAHAGNLRVMFCFPGTAARIWKAPKTWSHGLERPSTKTYRPTCYAYLGSSWMKSSKHTACQPWIYFIFPPHKTLAEKRAFAVMPRCCRPNSFAKSRPNSSVSSWSAEDGEVPHIRKSRRHWAFGPDWRKLMQKTRLVTRGSKLIQHPSGETKKKLDEFNQWNCLLIIFQLPALIRQDLSTCMADHKASASKHHNEKEGQFLCPCSKKGILMPKRLKIFPCWTPHGSTMRLWWQVT